ncbi:YicC/YloC family endoribonuclease [Maricaulis sp.]|uniref:YicC/YloC family endoribonuclease n=1 Tax=Maricaulis sp. TaxID=1486257 RepID=UPI002623D5B5|nr:YicC/YloC family endoribonuclease [Maricaulis sp.]
MAALSGMTGFARCEGVHGEWRWVWETRSVNGKGLEARFRFPSGYDRLEIRARELAKARFVRGNIQSSLNLRRDAGHSGLSIDTARLDALLEASRPYVESGRVQPPAFEGLLQVPGVLGGEEAEPAEAGLDEAIVDGLAKTFDALRAARRDEGAAVEPVLRGHVGTIEDLTRQAAGSAAARIDTIRDRIAAKFADLLAGDLPEDRLTQEAAAMAVKMDVREEIERLTAHVASARELIAAGSPVGRKLDFLCQEFNREANTLCSKSSDSSLTQIGLELKNTIDQFREQVQNVE